MYQALARNLSTGFHLSCRSIAKTAQPDGLSFLPLFLGLLVVLVTASFSFAAQVTLAWDPNTEPELAGYKVYYGTASRNYSTSVDVGNRTSYTVTGLVDGRTYYFALTAYDAHALESDFSNEVSYPTSAQTCSYTISPTSGSFSSSGGTGSVSVTTQAGCAWTATSSLSAVSITSGASGTGNGTVRYSVAPNSSSSARSAALTIAGKIFTANQAGASTTSYTITASAGTGGSISPPGTTTVNSGTSRTYTITPASGYRIASVVVDGSSAGAMSSYTFSNVTANHTISASFVANTYALTVTKAGTGSGTVANSPSGSTYAPGTSVTLTASPSSGSTFAGWSGACSGTSTTCQVTMNTNASVTATFNAAQTYTITASAGTGGSISPSGNVAVTSGTSRTFTIRPSTGYRIWYLVVDGRFVSARTSYTFSNVRANHTIRAVFGR